MRSTPNHPAVILLSLLTLALCMGSRSHGEGEANLDDLFRNPAEETKLWSYWYWLNGDISKEGITKDLEAMARVGIKRAIIANVHLDKNKPPVEMFSPEWMDLTQFALQEAHRLGMDVGMFNGPGWSQSGGPWIKPEQSMRRVSWVEIEAEGGRFSKQVRPAGMPASQEIAVLAIPRKELPSMSGVAEGTSIRFSSEQVFTARSLVVNGKGKGELFAMVDNKPVKIAAIEAKGGNPKTDFLPNAPEVFSFKDTTAREFILEGKFSGAIELSTEPKVAQFVEKQLGRMHPTPSPTWESYIFPDSVEPADNSSLTRQQDIINLTDQVDDKGMLHCKLPEGLWTIIHFGMVSTGVINQHAPPSGSGLECDKMSKVHTRHHFNGMFGKLLDSLSPEQKKTFVGIVIDSYEVGPQNWTDDFGNEFENRHGYDPLKLLPVLTGRVIDSAKTSDQFLWDLRRAVADMIAENHIGVMSAAAREHGLSLWCENYGHWGFPGEFTIYGGYSDEIAGEFWTTTSLGNLECRVASSTAHIYGKKRIYAEAFTSKINHEHHPAAIKARGEELMCEGINHFVLHVYAHQTSDEVPGKNPWFGTAFHRNTPWFLESGSWVKYLQRCHTLLQQGEPASDVAVYIGDFAPQMVGPANPLPNGYDYDYIGSDAILRKLHVVDNEWVVYDEHDPKRIAARWKLLALPETKHVRPQVRQRLQELERKGGRIIQGVPISPDTLQAKGLKPWVSDASCDVRWKARRLQDGDMLFFLSNFKKSGPFEVTLQVSGKTPEMFDPVTGQITRLATYKTVSDGTRVRVDIEYPSDSFFLVFRDSPTAPSVVDVASESGPIKPGQLDMFYDEEGRLMAEASESLSATLSLSDGTTQKIKMDVRAESIPIDGPWEAIESSPQGFSVVQQIEFNLPAGIGKDERMIIDLGKVGVMAQVTLNNKKYDTLWRAPYTLDVTDAMKADANRLEVRLTSTAKSKPTRGEVRLRIHQRKPLD